MTELYCLSTTFLKVNVDLYQVENCLYVFLILGLYYLNIDL